MGERTIRFGQSVPAILLLVLAFGSPARCQEMTDATLTIRFANGQQQFHVGEAIPIELAFTSSIEETYEINQGSYDRSGWLNFDQFHVSPPGRDPLHNYYLGGPIGYGGDALSGGSSYLGSQPRTVREDLNEWVSLDQPGEYTLFVTSDRVSRRIDSKIQPVELRSNTIYFEIIPADDDWQAQTLSAAKTVLDDPASSPEERHAALRTLRFLDSPSSVQELVRQLGNPGNDDSWDCVAGLMGSKHQQLVVNELEASFSDPDTAITENYVTVLATTRFFLDHKPMPPYPAGDKQQQIRWQAASRELQGQFQEARNDVYARAVAVVGMKEGQAKVETVQMLLEVPETGPSSPKPWESLSGDTLASAFALMPPGEQADVLQSDWDRLKVPAMVDALENVLDQSQINDSRLRGLALERLYDLDPDHGAARILEEIRQPHADLTLSEDAIRTLRALPNKTLPQFDDLLATRLEKGDGTFMALTAQMIGRYSTKAILLRVKAVYLRERGKWGSGTEDGLTTYFLRVDPDFAVRQMRDAPNLYMSGAFSALAKMGRWPEVEPTIIAKLNGPNLFAAGQAAYVLGRYGGKNAEKALWERLQELHAQWVKRAGELQDRPHMSSDAVEAVSLQARLVGALGEAQGWLLDDSQIARLEQLTLGRERGSVAQWRWKSPLGLSIDFAYDGRLQVHINGFYYTTDVSSLCAKLAEFPEGTQFYVSASGPRKSVEPVMQAIEDAAQEDGLFLKFAN